MSWDTDLTGTHLQIAQSASPRLRVMAGPGTGKSYAMKRRIARLIEAEDVDPNRILAVTFTRTAAADLRRELHALQIPNCERIHAGTLHAFCFKLLLEHEVFSFTGRVPRGLLSFTSKKVAQFELEPFIADLQSLGDYGGTRQMTASLLAFEADWARLQSEQPGWPNNPIDQELHQHLTGWLKFHRGILIGELVPEALRYLRNNPASPALRDFDHIVVDEYQDLNRAEQELIDILSDGKSLSIVGDVDQSIYSFRYANPEGIGNFSSRHSNVEDHALEDCRRCASTIVTVADSVICRNYPPAAPHRLVSASAQAVPGIVRVVQWDSLEAEAKGISSYIATLVNERGFQPGEILVLSPRRLIANAIKAQLRAPENNIAAHSFYNDKVMEPVEVQLALTKLQLFVNPEDRVALRFWLGFENPSWRRGQYATLRAYCEQNDANPFATLENAAMGILQITGVDQLVERARLLRDEITRLSSLSVQDVFDDLFPANLEWAEPIRELVTGKTAKAKDFGDLLDLLRTEITQPEMPVSGNFVRLMSMHKSKGLTSRVTIVVGCIHGVIPYVDDKIAPADLPAHEQEQRRLFYVALTRAKEVLVLSSVAKVPWKMSHPLGAILKGGAGSLGNTIACQFINELGPQALPARYGPTWIKAGFN